MLLLSLHQLKIPRPYRAGIKAGDMIVKIAGESTKDMDIIDAIAKMRGPKGSSIVFSILREGWTQPKDFSIVRDTIKIKSVKAKMIDTTVGYIKLTQFQEATGDELSAALANLKKSGMSSIILDLRNDPGGLSR